MLFFFLNIDLNCIINWSMWTKQLQINFFILNISCIYMSRIRANLWIFELIYKIYMDKLDELDELEYLDKLLQNVQICKTHKNPLAFILHTKLIKLAKWCDNVYPNVEI